MEPYADYSMALFGLASLAGGLIGGVARKLVPGVARVAGGIIRKISGGAARTAAAATATPTRAAITAGVGTAAVVPIGRGVQRSVIAPQLPGPGGQTRGAIVRAGQAIVPGGRTGRELTQIGEATDKIGRPLLVEPDTIERTWCPKGYVKVELPDGTSACALKGPARALGLWKGERKPPISAGEWRQLQVAKSVKSKARKIASTAGWSVKTRGASCRNGGRSPARRARKSS